MIPGYNKENAIVIKPGRDSHVRNKHPWVFMGAVASYPNFENGGILPVLTDRGDFIGYGYFNKGQSIVGRMFSFDQNDPLESFVQNIRSAIQLRNTVVPVNTNAYRLINGEGDSLPGLIVDKYGEVLVIQINTLGIEKLKPLIIKTLKDLTGITDIFEKSGTPTRRKEGLEDFEGWVAGEKPQPFLVEEYGLKFSVGVSGMQKTGFFLDQREMRQLVRQLAVKRKVLNCFSYTGGFSVYAMAGGANLVDTVDISKDAIAGAKANMQLNGFDREQNKFYSTDVSRFLQNDVKPGQYDFIILDPPAFAKRANDIPNASRGYREINRLALEKLPQGGLLLTSSCSAHVDKDLFQTIVFHAAKDAKRKVKILSYHLLGFDHPVNLFYPEGDYLKSLLLYVE